MPLGPQCPSSGIAIAHGQRFLHYLDLYPDKLIMIYDAKVEWNDVAILYPTSSIYVPVPNHLDWTSVKEVCSGIGCMGMAAQHYGLQCRAAMDINPHVAQHLHAQGHHGAFVGDVTHLPDRQRLHLTGGSERCLLLCGFPCQPLSTQGDGKGPADTRSKPFFATLQVAWEQQVSAVLLECVPGALQAEFVQHGIQRLAWSMGMEVHQRVLHLSRSWPSSRTRWWCILTFRELQIAQIPDMPNHSSLSTVGDLLSVWPAWQMDIERQVQLTEEEYKVYMDPRFGSDQRFLRSDKACPCILHSYGSVLEACPCGCRSHPLAFHRLERDGVRGFFVQSSADQRLRYLTTKEAALLLTVPATIDFANEKLGLALLGQCAAPVQAVWTLGHLFQALGDFLSRP